MITMIVFIVECCCYSIDVGVRSYAMCDTLCKVWMRRSQSRRKKKIQNEKKNNNTHFRKGERTKRKKRYFKFFNCFRVLYLWLIPPFPKCIHISVMTSNSVEFTSCGWGHSSKSGENREPNFREINKIKKTKTNQLKTLNALSMLACGVTTSTLSSNVWFGSYLIPQQSKICLGICPFAIGSSFGLLESAVFICVSPFSRFLSTNSLLVSSIHIAPRHTHLAEHTIRNEFAEISIQFYYFVDLFKSSILYSHWMQSEIFNQSICSHSETEISRFFFRTHNICSLSFTTTILDVNYSHLTEITTK